MIGSVVYRRTQIAWPTIVPLVTVGVALIPLFIGLKLTSAIWIMVGVYGLVLLLFAALTVTVTSDGIDASFGIGLVHKWVPFAEIESFAPLRTQWFNGWGIHGYRGGTLYNASGFSAVEFRLRSGRYVAIGTAEPDAVMAALAQATGKREAAHEAVAARRWTWGPQQTIGLVAGVCAVILAAVAIYTTVQPPDVVVGFNSFYVGSGFYRNTIPYPSIRSVTLEDSLPHIGFKTNGSSIGHVMRGNFRVDGWGTSRLFVNSDVPPFVVVSTPESHVVVNFSDPMQTRELYAKIKAAMRRPTR